RPRRPGSWCRQGRCRLAERAVWGSWDRARFRVLAGATLTARRRLFGLDHAHERVDQREVRESLREVAEMAPARRLDLLCVQLKRTGEGEQLLAQGPR